MEVIMKLKSILLAVCTLPLLMTLGCAQYQWAVHDPNRPLPDVVTPAAREKPPSDAIVLFDGKDLSQWLSVKDGGPAKWNVREDYMEIVKETGDIRTKRAFGDCQLHIEWAAPAKIAGESQDRGNSGVYLMSKYEIQVLDTYSNVSYADGLAAAVYGQSPPMVNASLPPGQWQTYDIIFRRPVFKAKRVVRPATITVFHNGVLVQDNFEIEGATVWKQRAKYHPHPDKLPILLQDHGSPVRYRNIWIRELPEIE